METIINTSLWDEILSFDELIHDFHFSEKVNRKEYMEDFQLNNQDE